MTTYYMMISTTNWFRFKHAYRIAKCDLGLKDLARTKYKHKSILDFFKARYTLYCLHTPSEEQMDLFRKKLHVSN